MSEVACPPEPPPSVLVASALTTLLSFAAAEEWNNGWQSVAQLLIEAPAAFAFVGIAALLIGGLPRLSIGLGWGIFGLGAAIGLLGGLLRVPDWLLDVDPVSAVPAVPFDDTGDAILRITLMLAASWGPRWWVRPATSTIRGPPKGSRDRTTSRSPGWISRSARKRSSDAARSETRANTPASPGARAALRKTD